MKRTFTPWISTILLLLLCSCSTAGDGNTPLKASGFIEGESYTIISLVGGVVEDVLVEEGQSVLAGDTILQLNGEGLRQQVDAAQAALNAARATLSMQEQTPSEADRTSAEAVAASAEAAMIAAQAELIILQDAYDPYDPPEQALLSAEENLAIASAGFELAQAQRDLLLAGPGESTLLAAEASVREAEANLRYIEELLNRQSIDAPINGRISLLLIQPGELAAPGAQLARIVIPESLTLTVYIPQDQLARVAIGREVDIQVDSYPDNHFSGVIASIADEAQFIPSTVLTEEERVKLVFEVEITVHDPDHLLHPGIPADAFISP
ncbi:MAG: HlyD family efflux transporter periplasmic adaptor subunit [Anaerolineales bacterium]|nr:HlyD family efflux transporter periplasmic adaptor subunit [Anaerolineales bacterium]